MGATTEAQLVGFTKQRYGDSLVDLVPRGAILQRTIDFVRKKKLGNLYHQDVVVANHQG